MKPPRKINYEKKQGGVLVMAMIVMLSFSILAIGLFKLRETAVVETVYAEHYKQAFWLAEAGLQDGALLVQYDADFRKNIPLIPSTTNTTVNGSYDITVVRKDVNALADIYDFEVTSVGSVGGATRRLKRTLRSSPGSKYAIVGVSGTTELAANVTIDGPVAQIAGGLTIKDSRYLNDYVIMGEPGKLSDKKGQANLINLPAPQPPSITSAGFVSEISNVENNDVLYPDMGSTNVSASNISGAHYFDADSVDFSGKKVTISDGTTIVSTGSISFGGHVDIGENVRIVAAEVNIANQATVDGGTLIFATGDINIRNASDASDPNGPGVVLLAQGEVVMDAQIDFRGVIVGEKGVHLNSNAKIRGTIIGGLSIAVDANADIAYDPSVFENGIPIFPNIYTDEVLVSASSWQELPSL